VAECGDVSAHSDELVQVYTTGSLSEGYLVKGRLEAEGIPVLIKGEGEGPYRVGPAYLWVPQSLEVQARQILESFETASEGSDS
jgi:phage major head subunit gpT-like protein